MRAFLNSILNFIASESLTDLEFSTVQSTHPIYDQNTYNDLSNILKGRESVSIFMDRLTKYYQAKGVDVAPVAVGKSNILVGAVL